MLWFFVYTRLLSTIALYHPTILGTIGQSEAWYSTNSLTKRTRYESASNMTIYPQRPGEKDCAHYMLTRTCKFGDSCKFDHPVWVPEGGIPDWKEVTVCYYYHYYYFYAYENYIILYSTFTICNCKVNMYSYYSIFYRKLNICECIVEYYILV